MVLHIGFHRILHNPGSLTSYHASADHLQFRHGNHDSTCNKCNQPVQGLCFRSRLVASTPEVLDNLATKDVHMLLGAKRKSEKVSSTLRFQRTLYKYICLISLQLPSMKVWLTVIQCYNMDSILVSGLFVWNFV